MNTVNKQEGSDMEEHRKEDSDEYSGKAGYPFFALTLLGKEFKANADAHGFNGKANSIDRTLLLIISELLEIFEDERKGVIDSEKIPGFSSMEEELADVVIRVLETSESRGLRIAEAVQAKHEYNKSRPYKHGKKF